MVTRRYNSSDLTKIVDIYNNTIKLKDSYAKFPIGYIYNLCNDCKLRTELRIIAITRSDGITLRIFQDIPIVSEKLFNYFNNVIVSNQYIYTNYIGDIENAINNEGILIEKREVLYSKGVIPLEILN